MATGTAKWDMKLAITSTLNAFWLHSIGMRPLHQLCSFTQSFAYLNFWLSWPARCRAPHI
jgi:hypothetical protein